MSVGCAAGSCPAAPVGTCWAHQEEEDDHEAHGAEGDDGPRQRRLRQVPGGNRATRRACVSLPARQHRPRAPRLPAPWHFAEPVEVAQLGRRAALAGRHGQGVGPAVSLSPVQQAWSTAAGASKRQVGHAAQGWACIQEAGSRSVGGRLRSEGAATSRRAPKRCAPPTRVRAQPCRRHGVSAQRRRRPDRCVASPPQRLGVPRCPCLGRPVFDGCARLSQCTQPQPARTAPRRLGRQCVRGGAGVSRTVVAAHTATTHPPVTLGSKIPDVELSYFDSEHQLQRLSTKDLCSGKKARRRLPLPSWVVSAPPPHATPSTCSLTPARRVPRWCCLRCLGRSRRRAGACGDCVVRRCAARLPRPDSPPLRPA